MRRLCPPGRHFRLTMICGLVRKATDPWIDRALQQGDPELALSALQWLAACETNETLLKLVERQRGSSNTPPELIQATLESALQDQRRCQTVREDQLRTAGGRLSEIALQAGLPGAAVAYMNQHLLSLPADQHPRLRQLLARDARAGDVNALAMIDASGPRIGLSVYDQAVFAAASDTLGGRGALKTLWRQAFVALAQDLPEDQVQAARTEGEAVGQAHQRGPACSVRALRPHSATRPIGTPPPTTVVRPVPARQFRSGRRHNAHRVLAHGQAGGASKAFGARALPVFGAGRGAAVVGAAVAGIAVGCDGRGIDQLGQLLVDGVGRQQVLGRREAPDEGWHHSSQVSLHAAFAQVAGCWADLH